MAPPARLPPQPCETLLMLRGSRGKDPAAPCPVGTTSCQLCPCATNAIDHCCNHPPCPSCRGKGMSCLDILVTPCQHQPCWDPCSPRTSWAWPCPGPSLLLTKLQQVQVLLLRGWLMAQG